MVFRDIHFKFLVKKSICKNHSKRLNDHVFTYFLYLQPLDFTETVSMSSTIFKNVDKIILWWFLGVLVKITPLFLP